MAEINPYELTGIATIGTYTEEELEEGQRIVPVTDWQSSTPALEEGTKLQDVYGTAQLPFYEFVSRIQTGERIFDPTNPEDMRAAEFFSENPAALQNMPPDLADVAKSLAIEGARMGTSAIVGEAGALAAAQSGKSGLGALTDLTMFKDVSGTKTPILAQATENVFSFGSSPGDALGLNYGEVAVPIADYQAMIRNPANRNILSMTSTRLKDPGFVPVPENAFTIADKSGTSVTSMNVTKGSPGIFDTGGWLEKGTTRYTPSAAQMGTNIILDFGFNLLSGQKPIKAIKNAGIAAAGTAIGTMIGGPIGGFIGGTLAKIFGGRVICNELYRQGLMTKKHVLLDYRFTRDYLTPTHVRGYHMWSIWIVKQLRKGRMVGLWSHLANHRANEIAYIFGKRDKPDYLGKIYRRLLEWPSWLIGVFYPTSDWSILYKPKEI